MILARFVRIADISSVPFFLTGIAKGKFPDAPVEWVLMDWDGIFSVTYNYVENESNILIFDLRKVMVYQTSGKEVKRTKLNEILLKLRKLSN